MRRVALCAAVFCCGCIDTLSPGEVGTLRYFGEVRGDVPLRLLPPVTDRAGNNYVMFGSQDLAETTVFVGHADGGWSSGCTVHEGLRGVHGFVGWAEDRAWYWSGDALVEVSGASGGCRSVLDRDPVTTADLDFLAVVPYVSDAPSRRTLVALVMSPSDTLPWLVVVDLDRGVYTNLERFAPDGASNVTVLGVGGDRAARRGVILLRYDTPTNPRAEAVWVDNDAAITGRITVPGAETLPEDAVAGFLQLDGEALAMGLLQTGELVTLADSFARVQPVNGMTPVGVQRWEDRLYLVGTNGTQPLAAPIDGGNVGTASPWSASLSVVQALSGTIEVLDDRSSPRRTVSWSNARSAIGDFPFLSAAPLHRYADGETGWLVAGPSFDFGGGDHRTSVAFAPMGVEYP